MLGRIDLTGHAPKNSTVEVFDEKDDRIATCNVGATGRWSVFDVELPLGEHQIRAVAKLSSGRESHSDPVEVTVPRTYIRDGSGRLTSIDNYSSDQNDQGLTLDEQIELAELRNEQCVEAAELYEQADLQYAELAVACADGFVVDGDTLADVLEIVKRSQAQFYGDVDGFVALRKKSELTRLAFEASVDALRRGSQ